MNACYLHRIPLRCTLNVNFAPTPKVATGALAGAFSVIVIWALTELKITIPPEVASAFTTVFSALASYIAPHSDPTPEQIEQIRKEPCKI